MGHVTGARDQNNQLTQYLYDAAGRLSVVVDAGSNRTTTLFDAAGNATQVTDALGNSTQYLFDALNRQIGLRNSSRKLPVGSVCRRAGFKPSSKLKAEVTSMQSLPVVRWV